MAKTMLRLLLSKWFFIAYFGLGLIYFLVFPLAIPNISCENSFFTTLALMTGSDPYSFASTIEAYKAIWGLAWIIHVGSWLLIPALVGLIVSEVAEDIKHERHLQDATMELIREAGVQPEQIDSVEAELQKELSTWISSIKKGNHR
jgi:hypothetical protein